MSNRVWKCDFCSKTDTKKVIIDKHEKTCIFNPKHKTCYTCKHFKDEWNYCDYDIDGECPKHEKI